MPTATSPLISDLAEIVGDQYVIWKPEDLLVYECDGSIDKATPQAVVLPLTAEEVSAIVRISNRHGAYIVARGAGTSLSGGPVALRNSVVMALPRMTDLIEVEPETRVSIFAPRIINLHLSEQVSHLGLFFAPDPASQKTCTIGGNVAENAGGPHCLPLGRTPNHVLGPDRFLPIQGTLPNLGIVTKEKFHSPDTTYWPLIHGVTAGALRDEFTYFARCILEGRKPEVITPEESMACVVAALAAERSAATGEVVHLN